MLLRRIVFESCTSRTKIICQTTFVKEGCFWLFFLFLYFPTNNQEHLIENEVSILRRVKHPNIIMLIEEMDTVTELYLVMELVKVRVFTSTEHKKSSHGAWNLLCMMASVQKKKSLRYLKLLLKPLSLVESWPVSKYTTGRFQKYIHTFYSVKFITVYSSTLPSPPPPYLLIL